MTTATTLSIITGPNEIERINTLYAFLSVDATGEGIISQLAGPFGPMLLVTAQPRLLAVMQGMAEQSGRVAGHKVRLVKFERAEVIKEIGG